MTQKDFAKQVCVSQAAVGSWTRDHREPSIRNFLWTCKIFSLLKNQSFFSVVKQGIKFFIQ